MGRSYCDTTDSCLERGEAIGGVEFVCVPMDQVSKFCEAVWKGDAPTIARLVSRIDPNGEDRWHRRVLSMAAQYGDARLVRQLLDRGADVDAGRSQLTPVAHAAARRQHEIVDLLRGAGAAISVVTSVYLGDPRAVAKADFIVDEEGTPLLLHAAQSLNGAIVEDLLDRGADVLVTDRFGETALHRVADLRRADGSKAARVATLLIERGAPSMPGTVTRSHRFIKPYVRAVLPSSKSCSITGRIRAPPTSAARRRCIARPLRQARAVLRASIRPRS
jgi:hypothetical protein